MTNRKWLESLSDDDFIRWLLVDLENLKKSFMQTTTGIKEWLNKEVSERNEV